MTTRKQWKRIAMLCTRDKGSWLDRVIAGRVALARDIERATEGGHVALVESGSDCDHVYTIDSEVMAVPTVMAAWCEVERRLQGAEGPMSVYFVKPSERPESEWRDLGMEAFENGHPHLITTATV